MTSTPTLIADRSRARAPARPGIGRFFYSGASVVILILSFLGFQEYYLHGRAFPGRDIAPPLHTLIVLHAIAMTAWVILSTVQPLLIVRGSYRTHMTLGLLGAGLAACVVGLGLWLGIQSARITPPEVRIWGETPRQFLTVPALSALLFGAFVAVGVWHRYRPEIHRPMMLMASLAAIPAAVSRIGVLNALYEGTALQSLFGPYLWTVVLATLLLLVKWVATRTPDRWFAIGYASLVAGFILIWRLGTTDAWDRIATLLVS